MDVFSASRIFYKNAQDSSAALERLEQLTAFSNKLNAPNGIQNPTAETIDTSLLATLVQEVDNMEEQERFPITRPESKAAAKAMYDISKRFHMMLTNKEDVNALISQFQNVRNAWDNYRRSYLSEQFLNDLQLAKSEASSENQPEFDIRWNFWKELIDQMEGTISGIEKILKDWLTGSPDVALEPEPV